MNLILISILILGMIGILSAALLFYATKKFKVEEDIRIDKIEAILPGANCGGCGFPGCRGFAEACIKSFEDKLCPVGGNATMSKVAGVLGMEVSTIEPKVAVVRCNGTCENRPKKNRYDGAYNCAIAASLYSGETDCSFGCLGLGDCVASCKFGAIVIGEDGLPIVDEEKCTACGSCVKACPKNIIELRKKGPKSRKVFVRCVNKDKGAITRKSCSVGCIGCTKCEKECAFNAITIENNCAYIDFRKCTLCRKCVQVCPTNAIAELNFPSRKGAVESFDKKE